MEADQSTQPKNRPPNRNRSPSREPQTALPIKHDITLIYTASFGIAALMAIVSIAGLISHNSLYPTEALLQAFVSNDAVNLLFGLPLLLISMGLTWRGQLLGLLCWPGALFFVLYNYLVYLVALPLSWSLLLYLALVMLSVYSLIALVASIDATAVQQRLLGQIPEKLIGATLFGFGLLFCLRVIGVIVSALMFETPLAGAALATNIADFLITPAWVIGGFLLWRRKELGYLIGLGLLFQANMLFIALINFLLLQPFFTAAPLAFSDIVVVFLMSLICFFPLVLFVGGVHSSSA